MLSRPIARLSLPRCLGPSFGCPPGRRRLHHSIPQLSHDFSADGVPKLLSPAGFALAWTQYMTLTLDKLNALTAGTELQDKTVKSISLMTAREPSQAVIFNYASMAHNTHFFFKNIVQGGTPPPPALRRDLEASFSSMETLRREFVLTASAMFGPGFVWLVKTGAAEYRVLPTYLAGSPYPGAHWRAQPVDMNSVGNDGSAAPYLRSQVLGSRGRSAAATNDLPPGGVGVTPLLCLNTWEHGWLMDWGLGVGGSGGKVAYAEAWWDVIDWEKVADEAGLNRGEYL